MAVLERGFIEYEVLVIDDHSKDNTGELVDGLTATNPNVACRASPYSGGFGLTVRYGLEQFT